ncbi:hypothetical protein VNO77_41865 [Canavalia gladiata]|uniref:Uncharacterized protein n=1 Tax=Canavalia gladiata TaxID=3824 RepID=A0AAN9K1M2_CANGL
MHAEHVNWWKGWSVRLNKSGPATQKHIQETGPYHRAIPQGQRPKIAALENIILFLPQCLLAADFKQEERESSSFWVKLGSKRYGPRSDLNIFFGCCQLARVAGI